MKKSPYLKSEKRLEDVIAGIQVLGAYEKWSSRRLKFWITLLGEDEQYWKKVFEEHSEFFRINNVSEDDENQEDLTDDNSNIYVSIRWRFAYPKTYDFEKKRELDETEYKGLSKDEKNKLTRRPLTNEQIQSLIATAINLKEKAISDVETKKWWKPLLTGVFVILGALIGLLSSNLTNQSNEELWQNEKLYLLLEKSLDKRIEIYERMVKILNTSNEAKLMWTKINTIKFLDSMKIEYYQQNPIAIRDVALKFDLNKNNQEQLNAISRINDLSNDYSVTVSLARTFFGKQTNSAIDSLKIMPWWENDSIAMTRVITSMSDELYDYE
jgi:hypothetical protein